MAKGLSTIHKVTFMTSTEDPFKDVIGDPGEVYYERLQFLEKENTMLKVRVEKLEHIWINLAQFLQADKEHHKVTI